MKKSILLLILLSCFEVKAQVPKILSDICASFYENLECEYRPLTEEEIRVYYDNTIIQNVFYIESEPFYEEELEAILFEIIAEYKIFSILNKIQYYEFYLEKIEEKYVLSVAFYNVNT